jgi:hypothetical protein
MTRYVRTAWLSCALVVATSAIAQAQAPQPGRFTLEEFRALRFIEGDWRGSGYTTPFFERYTFVNDSTIEMTAWTDSTFSTRAGNGSMYSYRGGEVRTRSGGALIRIDSLGHHFSSLSARPSPWVFRRVSEDRWTATLGADRRTVYTMDRMRRP